MINFTGNIQAADLSDVVSPAEQAAAAEVVEVANTSHSPLSLLPVEMIQHIGSFLDIKSKVIFDQVLEQSGLNFSLYHRPILREFQKLDIFKKIELLLLKTNVDYDLEGFYKNSEAGTALLESLFSSLCQEFEKNKHIANGIAAHVEALANSAFAPTAEGMAQRGLNPRILNPHLVQHYFENDVDDSEATEQFIHYLFPDLKEEEVEFKDEIRHRISLFVEHKLSHVLLAHEENLTKAFLLFLRMKQEHRGISADLLVAKQKLPNEYLQPILEKMKEKIISLPLEGLRAFLMMSSDRSQADLFCEKAIEYAAADNPFYSKGSPYFYLLKEELRERVLKNTQDNFHEAVTYNWIDTKFLHHIAYNANEAKLREYADVLLDQILHNRRAEYLSKSTRVARSQPDHPNPASAYSLFIPQFYEEMESEYQLAKTWAEQENAEIDLLEESAPEATGLVENSFDHVLNRVAAGKSHYMATYFTRHPEEINRQGRDGNTLLHILMSRRKLFRLTNLDTGDYNLNMSIKNDFGITPMMQLVQMEDLAALETFILRKKRVGLDDSLGFTTTFNLDINQQDEDGNTALHHAVRLGKKLFITKMLSYEGIDFSLVNKEGKTAFDLAPEEIKPMLQSLNLL